MSIFNKFALKAEVWSEYYIYVSYTSSNLNKTYTCKHCIVSLLCFTCPGCIARTDELPRQYDLKDLKETEHGGDMIQHVVSRPRMVGSIGAAAQVL